VLGPDRRERTVSADDLTRAVIGPLEASAGAEVDRLLARTVTPRRRARARAALLAKQLAGRRFSACWLLRARPGDSLLLQARRAGLHRDVLLMIAAHAAELVLMLASWWAVARGALAGRYDKGWLIAWIILLVTVVPFRLASAWSSSRLAIRAGTILKSRILVGALRLHPNEIRHQGAGQLLGRVLELSALESLALGGGLASVVAVVEIAVGALLLASGTGGAVHVVLFLAFFLATLTIGHRYYAEQRYWTDVRLGMTHDLVERMVGHRTRIAQEPRERWHDGEDQALERYLGASRRLDLAGIAFRLVPRAWLLVGIAALGPSLVVGSPATVPLAIALGGVLLGYGALQSLVGGVTQVAGAAIAWQQVGPLVRAAARVEPSPVPSMVGVLSSGKAAESALLIDAQELRFGYDERREPVLRGSSLRVRAGDRLLLEGPSGGGKSTFASLLTGLREPESGLLLLGGLDRRVLGADGWRRRVVAAPQFHENHVFSGTLAFNLLMGRKWPPTDADLDEAETVCRELELGDLLDRMPSGLQQMVGETGWQLSHGERSRVFIARALLQDAELVVLDESFAALDPETLRSALRCVLARARTVLVIAHP
jgi:ATP-binding cassette subfamily B protein